MQIAAADTGTQTVYAYYLTASGSAAVLAGTPLTERARSRGVVAAQIHSFIDEQAALRQQCCILAVRLREPSGIPPRGGTWRDTCSFFASIMRECFTRDTTIIELPPLFIALLARDGKPDVERALPLIRARLERHLTLAPQIDYSVFAPEEIRALMAPLLARC